MFQCMATSVIVHVVEPHFTQKYPRKAHDNTAVCLIYQLVKTLHLLDKQTFWSCNISVWTYLRWSYICSCFVIRHLCIFTHLFYFWYLNSCHMLFNLFNLKIYEWNIFATVKASDQLPSRLLMYVFWSLRHPFRFYGPSGHLSCPMWVNIWSFNKTWCYCSSLSLFHWPEVVGAAAQHYICLSGYNTSVVKTSQLGAKLLST